jgi:hypothetical protein
LKILSFWKRPAGDGRPLPMRLKAQIIRELDRIEVLLEQLKTVEAERDACSLSLSTSSGSHSLTYPAARQDMRASRLTRCLVYSGAPGKGLPASYAPFSSPPGERPHPHAFSPAIPAAAYLGIPADAKLIKAVMRGIIAAIPAEAAESLGSVAQ